MGCASSVLLSDDAGKSNTRTTIHCQLADGHPGKHRRTFTKLGRHPKQGEVLIEWDRNIDYAEDPDEHEVGGQG